MDAGIRKEVLRSQLSGRKEAISLQLSAVSLQLELPTHSTNPTNPMNSTNPTNPTNPTNSL